MMDGPQDRRSTETISETEQLDNETMHSRSLSEVTKAVANEAQGGFSSANNTSTAHQSGKSSGSATINADPLNVVSLGLFGDDPGVTTGGTSESDSTVNTSGRPYVVIRPRTGGVHTQKVRDRTQQHANSVRNRRASIIARSLRKNTSASHPCVTNYTNARLSLSTTRGADLSCEVGISDVEKCIFIHMKLTISPSR